MMKTITLHTASLDNAGRYLPAGASVTVGTAPGDLAKERAETLIAEGAAVAAPPAKGKPARPPVQPNHTSDEAE